MLFRGPTVWRWSHYRHHTDTIIVGRDAEIVFQRPPSVPRTVLMFTHIEGGSKMFWRLVKHAFGRVDDDAKEFVPENEHRKIVWESRIMVAIVAGAAVWSLVAWTPLPILFIGGPSIYGAWLMVFFGITQHAGLRENTLDHRYSTRTVYMNPVLRFLYLNMNYHVEHHLFPSVPYPALAQAARRDQVAAGTAAPQRGRRPTARSSTPCRSSTATRRGRSRSTCPTCPVPGATASTSARRTGCTTPAATTSAPPTRSTSANCAGSTSTIARSCCAG